MPNLKTYDLFISHAWKYGDDYDRLVALLDSALYFSYRNYSAPKDKPIAAPWERLSKADLRAHLERKVRNPPQSFERFAHVQLRICIHALWHKGSR